jgi:hypothetical protein
VPPAAGRSPVMPHSSTSAAPPWSPMPAATVPACPGAAPPAPRPRPGRRGRMHWLRRFHPRHRSPARRCHPVQASPATHSLARNGLRPRNTEGTGLRGRFRLHDAQRPACNNAHAAVRRTPGQAGSGHRRPDAGSHLEGTPAWRRPSGPGQSRRRDSAAGIGQRRSTASYRVTGRSGRTRACPPFCADVGLAPIKTKVVQIWESCAHEVYAGRAAVGVIGADRLLRAVACGQRDRYQATVRWTASRCGVGSRWPRAASNLVASMTKGARNW